MNVTQTIGRLLGYENVTSIDSVRPSFGAPWAHQGPAWVFFGCLALGLLAFVFYLRYQPRGQRRFRVLLAGARGLLLCLLLLILADPILELQFTNHPRPSLWVLFDGTESMAIEDELPSDERQRFGEATGLSEMLARNAESQAEADAESAGGIGRMDYVRALLTKDEDNLFRELADKFRLRAYLLDRPDGVRALSLSENPEQVLEPELLAQQLSTDGQVTALGNAFEDLALRHATSNLAGLLVISDFDQNSGTAPLSAVSKLGIPVYTLGIGPRSAVDVAVDLQAPVKMKRAEQSSLNVTVRHQELDGHQVTVRLTARRISGPDAGLIDDQMVIGEREIMLDRHSIPVEFPFTPEETGRFVFMAEVDPQEGEIVEQNNRSEREVTIIDDFLRLLFVEYEPTWEWRFVKEVFHRDKLVGMRGFRTYLRSSDPVVRETNDLFVPSLTLPRSEFFKYDVIFLGDMPASTLSTRFCEMTKEFVSQFGGGLVVMAGPRFGPGQLAGTPLADMLPVVVDPDARLRDEREFELHLTPFAGQYDFMRLGDGSENNLLGWSNLGRIPWYQPVKRIEASATTVLAEHPTDTCIDGQTPQPLIAIRKYGRGEVIYIGFNEMWRLRRMYGELYYRQFWGQLIHRLGLSHALGSQKRFVVRTDRQQYQADDKVLLTVEAYDDNFEPLTSADLPQRSLKGELIRPGRGAEGQQTLETVSIAELRPGIFETRIPVFEGGEYRVRVVDPIAEDISEVHFQVTSVSAERRSAVRNFSLQQNIAATTAGKAYELDTVRELLNDFNPPQLTETTVEIFPLWSTWFSFGLVVLLMLGEWFFRKMVNLA